MHLLTPLTFALQGFNDHEGEAEGCTDRTFPFEKKIGSLDQAIPNDHTKNRRGLLDA
jgi:hypothetical protein